MNVANAIGAEFSLEEQESIEEIPTDSLEAYALYLRASSIRSEDPTGPGRAGNRSRWEPLLLTAIDLDPKFALAYDTLAALYSSVNEEALTLEYAHKALELDPDLGSAYGAMTNMYYRASRFDEALAVSEQAFQRSPADSDILIQYARTLIPAGRVEESLRVLDRVIELDPASSGTYFNIGWHRWDAGDRDGGLVAMRRSVELDPGPFYSHRALGMMEATLGNRVEGEAQVRLAERLAPDNQLQTPVAAYIYRVAGLHDDAARIARAWAQTTGELPRGDIQSVFYYLALEEEEQALDELARVAENPPLTTRIQIFVMTNAFDDPILDKPEFQALRAELRAKVGWN